MDTEVALIVDPIADAHLIEKLLAQMPIWIVGTQANKQLLPPAGTTYPSGRRTNWTTYDINDPAKRAVNALDVLGTLHEHHPYMTKLRVFGLAASDIREDQWETEAFSLIATEDDSITFQCDVYSYE